MASYRVISADNHVFEPEDLWTSRAESKFKDRAPHVERLEAGDFWFFDGMKGHGAGGSDMLGQRFEEPEKLGTKIHRAEEARAGGYIPEEHVKDLDIDGIDMSIIYPTIGIRLYSLPASDILTPNPPKDTDGRREDSGRVGEGATGEMAGLHWGRLEVGGRSSVAA